MSNIEDWLLIQFGVSSGVILNALKMSPSSQGYIHGALSEILLKEYLESKNFKVFRIKEKPAGGFNEKKIGYKGDFLICKNKIYYVVECKGLKTNSEFRSAETDEVDHSKKLDKKKAFKFLKKYINIDKMKIFHKGQITYSRSENKWKNKNPSKNFPSFRWKPTTPGPDNADLSNIFKSNKKLEKFINDADETLLTENAFRERRGLYKVLQTHEPSERTDPQTGIKQAAPLVSDFSIMAVDLFQRTGKHEFVFMNPLEISHSPSSPNHLYQNYIIDILIPGKKDNLNICPPWYSDIDNCIKFTKPNTVEYDESQIDFRENE